MRILKGFGQERTRVSGSGKNQPALKYAAMWILLPEFTGVCVFMCQGKQGRRACWSSE